MRGSSRRLSWDRLPISVQQQLQARGVTPPATQKRTRARRATPLELPEDRLAHAACARWPEAVREHRAIPGRRYRLDIAFIDLQIAIEIDGFQHHSKYLADFTKDRVRQNLLTEHGWRIVRFTAGQVIRDLPGCLDQIERVIHFVSHHTTNVSPSLSEDRQPISSGNSYIVR